MEQRTEWAGKANARSNAASASVRKVADNIPFGQPILVGHHSERHARRDAERIRSGMDRAVMESKKAEHHEAKAANIAAQLDRTIFSDDTNAVDALKKRIAEREAEAAHMKEVNAAFKNSPGSDAAAKLAEMATAGTITNNEALKIARFFALAPYEKRPYPAYALTNLRASIRRDEERLVEIQTQQQRTAEAEAAGGMVIGGSEEYARITFAEKPERDVLDALRTAGFRWSQGSWVGLRAALPQAVRDLANSK